MPDTRLARELAVSAANNAVIGGLLFNPLNVLRARLQLQSDLAPGTYRSLRHAAAKIAIEDGVSALWRYGVAMSMIREMSYGGAQWGLYTPFKRLWGVGDGAGGGGAGAVGEAGSASVAAKVAAGLSAGAVASAFVTPVDLVMVRQFVEGGRVDPTTGLYSTGLRTGHKPPGVGSAGQLARIFRAHGLAGLYRGWEPTVARAAAITTGLTVSYDHTKELSIRHGVLPEGFRLHVVASVVAGVSASVLCAPMDVVKSKVMAAPAGLYAGWLDCATKIVQREGAAGLCRGITVNMARLCPCIIVQLPVMEQMRLLAGLDYFGAT